MTEDRKRRVTLYARVSTDPQETSLEGQLRELREHAAREGLDVVEEVRDLAEKHHTL
jgi:predicted site-specific integrase-resolvase